MSVHLKPSQTVNTNLYCCNLPLAADKADLISLFSPFGQLTHCTVLATLDAAGRRRAFLDFATPAQAAEAKRCTHTKVWHGYALEVTYATVQRSTGPLSIYEAPPGGWDKPPPRTNSEAIFEYVPSPGQSVPSSRASSGAESGSGSAWGTATSGEGATVVVTNLDLTAVGSPSTLSSLLTQFGQVRHVYVDAPNQVGVLSFAGKEGANAAVARMDGAQVGRHVIGAVVWEDWEEAERHSDHDSSVDLREKQMITAPAPSVSPSPPQFSPTSTTQSFVTNPNAHFGTPRLDASCSPLNGSHTATRPLATGGSTLSAMPVLGYATQPRTATATAPTATQTRNPLGPLQLNPAAREFTARR